MISQGFVLNKYLNKDEKVLWVGKPEVKAVLDPKDVWFIPMTVLFNVFIIYKAWFEADIPVDYILILFGVYLLIGRFIYKAFNKTRTLYAVTNQRIIIINKLWNDITEKPIESITHIEKNVLLSGIGTIRFGYTPFMYLILENTGFGFLGYPEKLYGTPAPTFFDIKDADKIYQLVKEQMR